MKNVLIFGASGHGSVVLDTLERSREYSPVGFVDSFKEKGTKINGYEVLGTEFDLPVLIEQFNIEGGIVAVGDNWGRKEFVKRIRSIYPRFKFVSAVHPSAIIGKDVSIGLGSVILPGAILNANAFVGDHCILNTKSSLDHDSKMGSYSSLAPGAFTGGNVIIGQGTAICLGAKIIECVTIGDYSVIGSNSLVLKDIPHNSVAYGTPTQIIRQRTPWEPYLREKRESNALQLRLDYTGT
ncbi:MAG: acetyltransferase [Robiginitalea sp.]|jgi:sugar O-acyltransferase (sialic acid O-acetyltransferase NeuD family)